MSANGHAGELHLSDLTIQGFCGIRNLTIKRLGRVTLIAGMNGVGKTTVLDAVRVFADRGRPTAILDILQRRNEFTEQLDEDGNTISTITWNSLFHHRRIAEGASVIIGPRHKAAQLVLSPERLPDQGALWDDLSNDEPWRLMAEFGMWKLQIPMVPNRSAMQRVGRRWQHQLERDSGGAPPLACETLGPGLLTARRTLELWATVALTDAESRTIEALNLLGAGTGSIERVAVIGAERSMQPRAIVRVAGQEQPIPLSSLGDGAMRVFSVALALANSRGGFLLIDEAENGIHHSVQDRFWNMILKAAHRNDVQVLATTHSWDAVASYARAASELDEVEGALVRLERDGEDIFAVEYSERELSVVATQGIEVR